MRILHLYRPRVPSLRAQAVQVVHTCSALAARGHSVSLFADYSETTDPDRALAAYGLERPPTLDLRIAPTAWPPGAGLWFRYQVARWCQQPGIVYARAKRYVTYIPSSLPVVIEAHEVDSALDQEAGRDPQRNQALEQAVYRRAVGVVTNCGGTLRLLEQTQPVLPARRRVIHNATAPDRVVARQPGPVVTVGYTGSPRAYKGLAGVIDSLPSWPAGVRLELVGGAPEGVTLPAARISVLPPVPYAELPAKLATYHALLLPLDDNLFGRTLTSPLKLWDYLATGIPIIAADLPTTREIGGDRLYYYTPNDPRSLAAAVAAALAAGQSPPLLRTWEERAAEVEAFLEQCLG